MKKTKEKTGIKKDGTGSVRQRKDGRWEGRYYFEGKRCSVYAPSRAETQSKLNKILVSIEDETYIGANSETVIGFLVMWLKEYSKSGIEPATETAYKGYIYNHVLPYFENRKLQSTGFDDFQDLLNEKRFTGRADGKEGGLSPKSIMNIRNMLHLAFETAVFEGLIAKNPVHSVKIETSTDPEPRVLDDYENDTLQNYLQLHDEVVTNGMLLLLNSGLRRGELLGLRWQDVDFSRGVIHVRHAIKRIIHPNKYQAKDHILLSPTPRHLCKTGIYLAPPKSKKSKRMIPLGKKGIFALKRQKQRYDDCKGKQGGEKGNKSFNSQGFVFFLEESGMYLEPRYFESHFKQTCVKAGISEDVNIHATRHTFATVAVSSNPHDVTSVKELLGHAQLETTFRYLHAFDEKKIRLMADF